MRCGERGFDQLLLTCRERVGETRALLAGLPASALQPRWLDCESVALTEHDRSLDHVLHLAHIARPVVGAKLRERSLVDFPYSLAGLLRVACDEVLREQRDVAAALAQWRQQDRKHVEP